MRSSMALSRMLASTSGGSASAWQVWPLKARLSVALGGAAGGATTEFAGECLDVFQEGQEHRDAGRVVVADVQHLGRAIVTSKRGGEIVPIGGGVETTAAHHRHAERVGDAGELRDHAARLADHDQPCRLPGAVVEGEVLGHGADGRHELLGAVPVVWLGDGAAVIADDGHRDDAGAPGAIKMLCQALISAFRLLVVVGANETVEDLTDSQRQ